MKCYLKASSNGYSKDVEYVFKEGVKRLRSYGYKVSIKNNGIGVFTGPDDHMWFDYVDEVKEEIANDLSSGNYSNEDLVDNFISYIDDFEFKDHGGLARSSEYVTNKRACRLKYQQIAPETPDNYETVVELVNSILEDCRITEEFSPIRCIKVIDENHFRVSYLHRVEPFTLYFQECKEKFVTQNIRAAFEFMQILVDEHEDSWENIMFYGAPKIVWYEECVEKHPEIVDRLNVPSSQLVKELKKLSSVWIKNVKEYLATYNTDKYELTLNKGRNLEVTIH